MNITRLIQQSNEGIDAHKEQFAIDVLMGLCSKPKNIPAKYFYDDEGSKIFQKITHHVDYYPTRTEFRILDSLKKTLPEKIGESEIDIIELGAGDGHKSELIIQGFLEKNYKVNFYPIDISEEAMHLLEKNITPHPKLTINGVVAEYFDGLRFVRGKSKNRQLVLFLGSNIGNFNHAQSQGFFRKLWQGLNASDYALIGFDLKKEISKLTAAYNDSSGLTRDFNLNLLTRMNRELGANFNKEDFQHMGVYNPRLGAMESYLISTKHQEVLIKELERTFIFQTFEPIHLEYSFKFLKSDVEFLSAQTGFSVVEHYTDADDHFVDSLWQVVKSGPTL